MPPAFFQQRRLIAATIRFFDLFSGIGGFREGLRRAGGFTCVGHCEVDAYADKNYRLLFDTEGEWFCNDARTIETERMPDFDLLCAGFPCQAFPFMIMDAGLSGIQTPALLCDKRWHRQIHKMKRSLLDSCSKGMGDLMPHTPSSGIHACIS